VTLRGPQTSKKCSLTPDFSLVLRSNLDVLTTCKVKIKSYSTNSRIRGSKLGNPKIPKKIPQKLGFGVGSRNFGTSVGTKAPYRPMPKMPPKPPGGGDIGGQNLNYGPLFPETGGLWPTFFGIFGKPLGRATSLPNFVGLSSKTKILLWINMGPPSAHTRRNERVRKDYIGIERYRLNIPPQHNFLI